MSRFDDIVIRFVDPFEVSRFPHWFEPKRLEFQAEGGRNFRGRDAYWCTLPDILVDADRNSFVGLSFLSNPEFEEYITALIKHVNDHRFHYRPLDSDKFDELYEDMGTASRIELYWVEPPISLVCLAASLFDGCWLYEKKGAFRRDQHPFGY